MNDLTLLYYSANALDETIADNIRRELLKTTQGVYPIISVTQKPVDLGKNICVGDIGQSYYNIYRQIHTGVQLVETKYVATVEDDSLYPAEHFLHRPSVDDVFSYNANWWFLDKDIFWNRSATGMFTCIAPTQLLKEVVKQRFDKYPTELYPNDIWKYSWIEPGRDERLGLPNQKTENFRTEIPLLTLCYFGGTCGKPKRRKPAAVTDSLEYWGRAVDVIKSLKIKE